MTGPMSYGFTSSRILLPEVIQQHIYEYAYGKMSHDKLCLDIACWRDPACADCNDEIWAERFDTSDIEARERRDSKERLFSLMVETNWLRFLRESETIETFLHRQDKRLRQFDAAVERARYRKELEEERYWDDYWDSYLDNKFTEPLPGCWGCEGGTDFLCSWCRSR